MPGLVRVAGHRGLALRIAHDEAVLPGIRLEPFAGLRLAPVLHVPRRPAAVRAQVEGRPKLVLAVPGSRALLERDRVAVGADPALESGLLGRVAAVGGLDGEAGGGTPSGGRHLLEVSDGDSAHLVAGVEAGARGRAEILGLVRAGEAVLLIEEGSAPIGQGAVPRERVRDLASREGRGVGGRGDRGRQPGQAGEPGEQRDAEHEDQEAAGRTGAGRSVHVPRLPCEGKAGTSPERTGPRATGYAQFMARRWPSIRYAHGCIAVSRLAWWAVSRGRAVSSLGSTGEWPSGKAPDSGSGDRRFESFLASQTTRCCGLGHGRGHVLCVARQSTEFPRAFGTYPIVR